MKSNNPEINAAISKRLSAREALIGDRTFYRRAFSVVLPIILQNTISNIVGLLDNVMVGRLGTIPMSSVAISNQLFFVFYLCVWGAISGAGIYGAQFFGKGDMDGMRYALRFKHFIVGAIIAIAFVLLFFKGDALASFFIAENTGAAEAAESLAYVRTYTRIMLIGIIPFGLSQCYAGSLREAGQTKVPMIAGMIAMLANFVFNALLIFGLLGFPKLGVTGAAIATVISRFIEAEIILTYAKKHQDDFPFMKGVYESLHIPRELAKNIFAKSVPLLLNELLWSLGQTMLIQAYSMRGLDVVAAVSISNTVTMIFMEVCLSIGNATAILIGQLLGAEKYLDARKTFWHMAFLSVSVCVGLGLVLLIVAPFIPRIYNVEPEIRVLASQLMSVMAFLIPLIAFLNVCYFAIRSGGKTVITFLFDSVFTWVVMVSIAFILTRYTNLSILSIYTAVNVSEIIKAVIGFVIIKSGVWIQNIVS